MRERKIINLAKNYFLIILVWHFNPRNFGNFFVPVVTDVNPNNLNIRLQRNFYLVSCFYKSQIWSLYWVHDKDPSGLKVPPCLNKYQNFEEPSSCSTRPNSQHEDIVFLTFFWSLSISFCYYELTKKSLQTTCEALRNHHWHYWHIFKSQEILSTKVGCLSSSSISQVPIRGRAHIT